MEINLDGRMVWQGTIRGILCRVLLADNGALVQQRGVTDGGIGEWVGAHDRLVTLALQEAVHAVEQRQTEARESHSDCKCCKSSGGDDEAIS